ncbi:UPF0481 protein At3g47200-like [Macadamia integrifolia]|uniref:UPF0481 protein At3g47200-like n=1 Tax=Macadamia integrifolia TaxID=60698 RepID=UPI001C4F116C|nr:UPF0481 protein At3g47200-like [Macadamia integrifolia]
MKSDLNSIGPFHHGKENLRAMETHKWQYLHSFVDRKPDITLPEYVKTMKQIEERTRQCYSESISTNSDEFVTMMLFDGCFMLEFLLRNLPLEPSHREDPVSSTDWLSSALKCDFILLENQLPFFVLECLYKLTKEMDTIPSLKFFAFPFLIGQSLLRNMICFEQLHCVAPRYITDNASLLDSFIDSAKDVILLREHGIIKSLLGDHEQVSLLFNKLVKEVNIDAGDFYFSDICQDLNAYYRVIWHSWKANLRHTYFNTPWSVISVLAAAVLLVLTLLQTTFTIKSSH